MKLNVTNYFNNLKGYRISGGHFELGSNLHIRDYFYAKRIFYNSFYTNRFAFLISRFILSEFSEKLGDLVSRSKKDGTAAITLLGHESYSDLLVSNVRKMLNDYLERQGAKCELFNHDSCSKDPVLLKNPEKLAAEVIMVFPISTTFSTSLKLQSEISDRMYRELGRTVSFLDPVINCLVIAPEPLEAGKIFASDSPAYGFGWQTLVKDKRRIDMRYLDSFYAGQAHMGNKKEVSQHYLVSLSTPWLRIDSCRACYPPDPSSEVCLTETKTNSITPNLIFGYPRSADYGRDRNIYPLFAIDRKGSESPLVYRRHIRSYGNNFIYYIRMGKFLQLNREQIGEWLRNSCGELKKLEDRNIVIVTSTSGFNSGFVNYVNDILFSDIATIIQYNPREEYLQNFKLFYTELLQKADTVIYVDDVLATTKAISELNFFVKNARSPKRGIDYSLCLVNRTGYYNYQKLLGKLGAAAVGTGPKVMNFIDIHVPPLAHREKYPYVTLVEKFRELSEKSVLDTMRVYFKRQEFKFQPIDLSRGYERMSAWGTPKELLQFLISHELMKLFRVDQQGLYLFNDQMAAIFEENRVDSLRLLTDFISDKSLQSAIPDFLRQYPGYREELRYLLLKVCSSEPFLNHGKIKNAVFGWVLGELVEKVRRINGEGIDQAFFEAREHGVLRNYCPFETFGFLLKRAAKLKMNYIYSVEVLRAVSHVLSAVGTVGYIQRYKVSDKPKKDLFKSPELKVGAREAISPTKFMTYYVGLLQELILDHESKALKLVYNIKQLIDENTENDTKSDGKTLKNTYNDHFMELMRMLVLENTFIFHSSCEKFAKKGLQLRFGDSDVTAFEKELRHSMKTYPFLYNGHMLSNFVTINGRVDYQPDDDISLSHKYMMMLKSMFQADLGPRAEGHTVLIEEKLKIILELCCKILKIERGGAFFAIAHEDRRGDSYKKAVSIVSRYATDNGQGFEPETFGENSFLQHVFRGITETGASVPASAFELTIDHDMQLHFRDNGNFGPLDSVDFSELQDTLYRNLLYLRITEIPDIRSEEPVPRLQAVIGFYSGPLDEEETERFVAYQDEVLELMRGSGSRPAFVRGSAEEGVIEAPRFDPKKVRQLLLLRNELSGFINHHLNNDSLRAYIEMDNNNRFSTSLKHGIVVYERLFDKYYDKVQRGIAEARDNNCDQLLDDAKTLQVVFRYLTNKMHLIALANQAIEEAGFRERSKWDRLTLGSLIEKFRETSGLLFGLEQDNIRKLEEGELRFDASQISQQELELRLELFPKMKDEMVFEVLYNIKKHAVYDSSEEISADSPLEIKLSTEHVDGTLYLCVTNNYLIRTSRFIRLLNAKLGREKGVDGLNLIHNILSRTIHRDLQISADGDYFKINIPIYIDEHENTNH